MNEQEYERRAKAIDAWAEREYKIRNLTEQQIEKIVARKFDALDAAFRRWETSNFR